VWSVPFYVRVIRNEGHSFYNCPIAAPSNTLLSWERQTGKNENCDESISGILGRHTGEAER
jgi:hypothetical protein